MPSPMVTNTSRTFHAIVATSRCLARWTPEPRAESSWAPFAASDTVARYRADSGWEDPCTGFRSRARAPIERRAGRHGNRRAGDGRGDVGRGWSRHVRDAQRSRRAPPVSQGAHLHPGLGQVPPCTELCARMGGDLGLVVPAVAAGPCRSRQLPGRVAHDHVRRVRPRISGCAALREPGPRSPATAAREASGRSHHRPHRSPQRAVDHPTNARVHRAAGLQRRDLGHPHRQRLDRRHGRGCTASRASSDSTSSCSQKPSPASRTRSTRDCDTWTTSCSSRSTQTRSCIRQPSDCSSRGS